MRPDESRTVYDGELVAVTRERWGDREREVVEHPGSVAVAAVDRDGCVTLVRQFREPARRTLLELPAGTLEPGETALACARRELAEETGLEGGEWREAASFWTTPGFCRERMRLFIAEGVERGEASPADEEGVAVVRWPVADVPARLREIEDGKTLAGLLLLVAGGVSLPRP